MIECMKNSLVELKSYLTNNKKSYWVLFFLCFFASWSGVQFLINPGHFFLFTDNTTFSITTFDLYNNFSAFIPSTIFIFGSVILFFWFFKNLFDILLINYLKRKLSIKECLELFLNYSIPSFFMHLGLIFVFVTFILLSFIVYLLLLAFGLSISINVLFVLITAFKYLFLFAFVFTLVLNDFVLYVQYQGNPFIKSLKDCFAIISTNKYNFLIYALLKIIFIICSMLIFALIIKLFVYPFNHISVLNDLYQKFYLLKSMGRWQDYFINLLKLAFSFSLSVMIFTLTNFMLMIYNRIIVWNLFEFNPSVQNSDTVDSTEELVQVALEDSNAESE